jgi:ParB family chromosome partitioning protein
VAAFASPLDIQFRWASPLAEAVQKDPEGTLARARAIGAEGQTSLSAASVFVALVAPPGKGMLNGSTPAVLEIFKAGKKMATLASDSKGRAVVRFESGALPDARRKALAKSIEEFLKG